ncbi:MAG: putative sporulation protein YtxC [Bacillota bacterium]|nr:putative sporulation protein YtxC [Bacillota bacterium]
MRETLKIEGLPYGEEHYLGALPGEESVILEKSEAVSSLARYIIDKKEPELIMGIIKSGYSDCSEEEQAGIMNAVSAIASSGVRANICYNRRRRLIERSLSDYANSSDKLILEGFMRFRLEEYKKALKELVYDAADFFFVEEEYNNFIELLREAVSLTKSRVPMLNVFFDGNIKVCDESLTDVTMDEKMLLDSPDYKMTEEDKLIGTLIALCPEKIIIHGRGFLSNETEETIVKVFSPGVIFCSGCENCNNKRN